MKKYNIIDRHLKAEFLMVIVVAIWGSTLPIIKLVLPDIDSLYFIALRFTLAFLFLALVYRKAFSRLNKKAFYRGFYLGLCLFFGYVSQVFGLKYTTAARSGFITGLAVVVVPFLSLVILKKNPGLPNYLGAFIALIGLLFMTGIGGARIYPGDYLCLVSAVSFALPIVLLSKYLSQGEDAILLTLIQMGVVAGGAGLLSLFTNNSYQLNLPTIGVIAYTGLLATAFAYLIQSYAQIYIPATRAALIFAMEPVFGAVLSYLVLGERMSNMAIVGGILIVSGTLVSELLPHLFKNQLMDRS